jgi:hypothetical protein
MKRNKYITVFAVLNAVACSLTKISAEAGQENRASTVRRSQANTHINAKAVLETNAQWSADPERDWVRADERHQLHNENQSMKSKKNSVKSKGNGSHRRNNNVGD